METSPLKNQEKIPQDQSWQEKLKRAEQDEQRWGCFPGIKGRNDERFKQTG